MNNREDEIDKKIATLLREKSHSHEGGEYIEGAWEGFLLHKERVTKKKRTRLMWYSSAAAAILLLVGLFLLYPVNEPLNHSNLLSNQPSSQKAVTLIEQNSLREIASAEPMQSTQSTQSTQPTEPTQSIQLASTPKESDLSKQIKEAEKRGVYVNETENDTLLINEPPTTKSKSTSVTPKEREKESSKGGYPSVTESTIGAKRERDRRGVRFGVNLSPGFNSTRGGGSALNYGGGVSVDISIAKNVSISTGLQLEHQSVESRVATADAASSSQTEASLTNFDLPLNITWRFLNNKNGSYYLSGGLSSLAYLDEKYTRRTFRQQIKSVAADAAQESFLSSYRVENVEVVDYITPQNNNTFDIAGRLNIMVGYEQKLSSKLNLHVEPYVKIPLSGLASENMRFTTGGVTFKLSF